MILATLDIDGRERKVLIQAPKNGYFYVLDRTSGKLISAENFVPVNWASGIDLQTGRPIENPEARYTDRPFVMHPNALGAHSWHPMAFDPNRQVAYLLVYHSLFAYGQDPNFRFQPGTWNNAIDQSLLQVPDDPVEIAKAGAGAEGRLLAWDPVAQKEIWSIGHPVMQNGGVLATAGDLVFQGTGDGRFEARDAASGEKLWQFDVGIGMIASPVSYAPDGAQYIAVVAGYGGGLGIGEGVPVPVARPLGRVLAFKLGGNAELPSTDREALPPLNTLEDSFDQAQIGQGRILYTTHCYRCHGAGAQSSGVLPDLRRSGALSSTDAWRAILLEGSLASRGMASFESWLSPQQAEDIRAFVGLKTRIARQHAAK